RMRPYVIVPPPWYFDFFVVNQFDDCKIYVVEDANGQVHIFKTLVTFNSVQQTGWGLIDNFEPAGDNITSIVAFAEKGTHSTWNVSPVQDAWRNAEQVKSYNDSLKRLLQHPRPYSEFAVDESKSPNPVRRGNYHYVGHF